jgi:hypothetical protein
MNKGLIVLWAAALGLAAAPVCSGADQASFRELEVEKGAWMTDSHYNCVRNFYVSPSGNDSNAGTSESAAFKTIGRGLSTANGLRAGDCVNVLPGTYTEALYFPAVSGGRDAEDGYLALRSTVRYGAKLRPPKGAYSIVSLSSYSIIDGFDIQGGGGHAIQAEQTHHTKILNNLTQNSGGSGISGAWGDYYLIEGNISRYNSATNGYQTSGISIYQAQAFDTRPGYHIIVRANISHGNFESQIDNTTDGNGFIMDDFDNSQKGDGRVGSSKYAQESLVEYNLAYDNGGKGMHAFLSSHITFRNNFAWHNNYDPNNSGTWRGELNNMFGSNTWLNNIGVADPSTNSDNRAILDGGAGPAPAVWKNNVSFDGKAGDSSVKVENSSSVVSAADNHLGVNPMFLAPSKNPSVAVFVLNPNGPAAGYGIRDLPWDWSRIAMDGYPTLVVGSGETSTPPPQVPPETPQPPPVPDPEPTPDPTPSVCADTTVFGQAVPATPSDADSAAVELGLKLKANRATLLTAIRFYKSGANTGTHVGHIWSSAGALLRSVNFSAESASGWQTARLGEPLALAAGETVIVSYYAPRGHYAGDVGALSADKADATGLLSALRNGSVYSYGGNFPSQSYQMTNYYVDVVAMPASCEAEDVPPVPQADTVGPDLVISGVSDGQTIARRSRVTVTASASDAAGVAKVEFYVNGSLRKTDSRAAYNYTLSAGRRSGSLQLTVKAYDRLGNVTVRTLSVRVR